MDSYTLTLLIENITNLSEAVQNLIDFTKEVHEVDEWSGTVRNMTLENKLNDAQYLIHCVEDDLEKIKQTNNLEDDE